MKPVREGDVSCDIPYMWNLKTTDTNALTYKTATDLDLENESVVASGKDVGIVMEFGEDMHTPLYLKWVITRDLLYSTRDPAQCYMAVCMGGNLEENGYMYMDAYSLHSSSETITTLFVNQL